ncbi:MAG: hypothetical protein GY845_35470 [Planctomycetes bacterium]|nr:hypothetical protein [Planctomycetota bacterium]
MSIAQLEREKCKEIAGLHSIDMDKAMKGDTPGAVKKEDTPLATMISLVRHYMKSAAVTNTMVPSYVIIDVFPDRTISKTTRYQRYLLKKVVTQFYIDVLEYWLKVMRASEYADEPAVQAAAHFQKKLYKCIIQANDYVQGKQAVACAVGAHERSRRSMQFILYGTR